MSLHPMLVKMDGKTPMIPNARLVTGIMVDGTTRPPISKEDLIALGIPEGEHSWLREDALRLVMEAEAAK